MDIHLVYLRLFKTHRRPHIALRGPSGEPPRALGAKYLMWVCDPKDVIFSLYRINLLNLVVLGMPFTLFVKLFVEGK